MSKLLLKIPTRSRPDRFTRALWSYLFRAENPELIHVVVSVDEDDAESNAKIQAELAKYEPPAKVDVIVGTSKNKIAAVNRDIPAQGWDIIVVASDDMMCVEQGWDRIICEAMQKNYPDGDGCLWYNDKYTEGRICTMPIMGLRYYQRFNYVYHPTYISLWCDNEQTLVAQKLDRIVYSPQVLFSHEHPSNNAAIEKDALHNRNESYYGRDKLTFVTREIAGFYLDGCGGSPATRTKHSQNNEQQLIEDYFGKTKGCVLDIGCNDGKTLSNSLACIERGWKAVLVEPGEKAFDRLLMLHAERMAKGQVVAVNAAIAATDGPVHFFESGEHLKNGDTGLVSTLFSSEKAKWEASGNTFTETTVDGISFATLHKKIPDHFGSMDLISIDCEGADWSILQQMDLNILGCKMLIIEKGLNNDAITNYCKQFGLIQQQGTHENLIFQR